MCRRPDTRTVQRDFKELSKALPACSEHLSQDIQLRNTCISIPEIRRRNYAGDREAAGICFEPEPKSALRARAELTLAGQTECYCNLSTSAKTSCASCFQHSRVTGRLQPEIWINLQLPNLQPQQGTHQLKPSSEAPSSPPKFFHPRLGMNSPHTGQLSGLGLFPLSQDIRASSFRKIDPHAGQRALFAEAI